MSKTEKTRNEMYQEWLDEHVQVFPTPQKIKLSEFQVDWESLSGSFNLTLDGVSTKERLGFCPEMSGKPKLVFPVYHAPYGIPSSYSSVKITWETEYCILKQLKMLLPRFGDGEMCDLNRNKLDDSALDCIKKKVTDPNLILEFDMSYDFKI
jgi:hypothetical protein